MHVQVHYNKSPKEENCDQQDDQRDVLRWFRKVVLVFQLLNITHSRTNTDEKRDERLINTFELNMRVMEKMVSDNEIEYTYSDHFLT